MFLCVSPAWAERLHVQSLSSFSTLEPPQYMVFKALNAIELSSDVKLWGGYVVKAKISEIIPPKRLKRDASFRIIPVAYIDLDGNEYSINEEFVGKYSPKFELDKVELAKNEAACENVDALVPRYLKDVEAKRICLYKLYSQKKLRRSCS